MYVYIIMYIFYSFTTMQIILFYEEVNRNTSETNDTPHCRNSSKTQSRNHTEKETRYIHQHTNTSPLTFLA